MVTKKGGTTHEKIMPDPATKSPLTKRHNKHTNIGGNQGGILLFGLRKEAAA